MVPVLLDLLLDRVSARPSGLQSIESSETANVQTVRVELQPGTAEQAECFPDMKTATCTGGREAFPSDISPELKVFGCESVSLTGMNPGVKREHSNDIGIIDVTNETSYSAAESSYMGSSHAVKDLGI